MHVTRLLPAYIITVLLLATHAIAGAIEDGSKAYGQGNYAEAYHLLQPLAAQGDAVAQEVLGVMYAEGQGVQKDEAQAVQLFRQAAEQGNDRGQYNLGAAYVNGLGVPTDYVLGQMWFILAAAQGFEAARSARDKLTPYMTPGQIAEAQRLAREWKPPRAAPPQ
jgi:TPR repeat protein